jgi:hypothetical protein
MSLCLKNAIDIIFEGLCLSSHGTWYSKSRLIEIIEICLTLYGASRYEWIWYIYKVVYYYVIELEHVYGLVAFHLFLQPI